MTEQNPSRRRTPKKSRAALLLAATLLVFLAAGLLVLKLRGALPGGDREAFQVPEQIVVCLDAGHGDTDAGAVNGDRLEKDDNLRIALAVRDKLEAAG